MIIHFDLEILKSNFVMEILYCSYKILMRFMNNLVDLSLNLITFIIEFLMNSIYVKYFILKNPSYYYYLQKINYFRVSQFIVLFFLIV